LSSTVFSQAGCVSEIVATYLLIRLNKSAESMGEERVKASLRTLISSHSFSNIEPSAENLINALSRKITSFEKTH